MTAGIALSPEQERVIAYRGGDLQVIACAGSGKTESISRRIASLIAEGVEPGGIVAFTFTERAADELKERITRRVGEVMGASYLDRLGPMFVGTIHAYCFRLLQDHVPHYGNYDVLDEHRHAGILSREYRNLGLHKLGDQHWRPIRDWMRTVDVIGNELIDPTSLAGTPVGEVYHAYRAMLDRYHCLTFGLIIQCAVESLQDRSIYARVRASLRYLVVDEYQDINPAQERLIHLLAEPPVQLCVVGDDDQCIYQWRGSDVSNIVTFAGRRSAVHTETLEVNRRSRPSIVTVANDFAGTITGRLEKAMQPIRPTGTSEVVGWVADTDENEAERVAATIERLHDAGYRYRDIAVLFRSVRTSAPPLIEACRRRHIPIVCGGRTGLFLEPEISFFGEIFAWFVDGEWKDDRFGPRRQVLLEPIVAGLDAAFGDGGPVLGLKKYLEDWKAYRLRGNEPANLVGDFYRLLLFLRAQRTNIDTPEGSARFGAFARFSQVLADFEHVFRRGRYVDDNGLRRFRGGRDRGKPYFQALYNYLLHYARDAYEEFEGETVVDLDAVDILTVHQAKGLEWPVVFLPALVEGRFPSRRAGEEQEWLLPEEVVSANVRARYEGGEPEERRLFYVALTRARDSVYLSCFRKKIRRFKPSPFLLEATEGALLDAADLPLPGGPDGATAADLPPLQISFSDVALFDDCGYRFRLGTVLGFQQELAVELGYGKAIHHVLRQVAETTRAEGEVPDADRLRSLVDSEFYLPLADAPAFDRMHAAGTRLVNRYVSDYATDLRRVWATERPFELHLEDGIVSGRADVILDEESGRKGTLAIVDYKVAHDESRTERYRLQLAVYAGAGRGEGLDVEAAYLHELADGTRHNVDIGSGTVTAAVERVAASVRNIRSGKYQPQPSAAKCGRCDFRRVCRHTAALPE